MDDEIPRNTRFVNLLRSGYDSHSPQQFNFLSQNRKVFLSLGLVGKSACRKGCFQLFWKRL